MCHELNNWPPELAHHAQDVNSYMDLPLPSVAPRPEAFGASILQMRRFLPNRAHLFLTRRICKFFWIFLGSKNQFLANLAWFWTIYGQTDVKIRFGMKFCFRCTFPEVCAIKKHEILQKRSNPQIVSWFAHLFLQMRKPVSHLFIEWRICKSVLATSLGF